MWRNPIQDLIENWNCYQKVTPWMPIFLLHKKLKFTEIISGFVDSHKVKIIVKNSIRVVTECKERLLRISIQLFVRLKIIEKYFSFSASRIWRKTWKDDVSTIKPPGFPCVSKVLEVFREAVILQGLSLLSLWNSLVPI